jgi:nicotinate phosphoribosyltransferase
MADPPRPPALLTDLYELTMAAAYFENNIRATASFELFVRALPRDRGYLVAAGLEQALDYLEDLRFTPAEIDFLRRQEVFRQVSDAFFDSLKSFHFTGEVWALPEGTLVFAEEPLLRVTAPIAEAQIVETFLLSTLTFQTLIATKAARVVEAAQGRGVVEFGTRRAHGPEAGVLAARAAYIGGCIGSSNVEAGHRFGVPSYGTLAHSFVMAYAEEEESFRQFQRVFPEHSVLLVDTYDTLGAVEKIIQLGLRPRGVRLDSGDLVELSRAVRRRLDQAGLTETKIFASGDLNEFSIQEALARGAAVDFFGVGTELATSKDAPALSGVYKLVEMRADGTPPPRAKFSEDKVSYPGRKQVFRFLDSQGLYDHDLIALAEEKPGGEALLTCVMRDGRRAAPSPSLAGIQQRARESLERLPTRYRQLQNPPVYPVRPSPALATLLEQVRQAVRQPPLRKNPR